ncbi:MAG: MarR family winged helix-turn-helix transcriptional regulator [Limnochordia bacterium]|jgi:DNA-binding MarR family transcriptional regulator
MEERKPEEVLGRLLGELLASCSCFAKGEAACCGLTLSQGQTLLEIGSRKAVTLAVLADALGVDPSTMSRNVTNLVQRGWIQRREHPADRRFLQIQLTPQGEAKYRELKEGLTTYFRQVLQLLPEDDRDQVFRSLELLTKALFKVKCCR